MEHSEAWWEGYRACQNGRQRDDDPYMYPDDSDYQDWEDGWHQAGEDD